MQFKEVVVWLVIFIIGSLIVSYLVGQTSIKTLKETISSVISGVKMDSKKVEDPLVAQCLSEFNKCKERLETKYSVDINIIRYQRFDDLEDAKAYFDDWAGFLQHSQYFSSDKAKGPVVVVATHIRGVDGIKNPWASVCDESGELKEKTVLTC